MSPIYKSVFVTGTDTGIGKTFYAKQLLQSLNAQGLRTAAMKPLASGAELHDGELRNEDALILQQAASTSFPYELCNPYCFEAAIAPHLAAKEAGVEIDINLIQQAYQQLQTQVDVTVVEGVGGWLVPLDAKQTVADLVQVMSLPVILVVGMRLGCLNHALLTVADINRRGVPLLGWVANVVDPDMSHLHENIQAIADRVQAPLLDTIEFINNPDTAMCNQSLNVKYLEY